MGSEYFEVFFVSQGLKQRLPNNCPDLDGYQFFEVSREVRVNVLEVQGISRNPVEVDDSGAIEMYAALGKALVEFNRIEDALGMIFSSLVNAENNLAAISAFDGIESFNGKLAFIRRTLDALEAHKDERGEAVLIEFLPSLKQAILILDKFLPRRNFLAHSKLVRFDFSFSNADPKTLLLFSPVGTSPSKHVGWMRPKYLARLNDVIQVHAAFEALNQHIFSFVMRLPSGNEHGFEVLDFPDLPEMVEFKGVHVKEQPFVKINEAWFNGD
jgi:hypothetical protein